MSDERLNSLEDKLEEKKVQKNIAYENNEIAQLKAAEAAAKQKYGSNWQKVLGVVGKLGVRGGGTGGALQTLYSVDPSLRDLAIPRKEWRR